MMLRAVGCSVALILGLLLSLYVTAAPAAERPQKPLDIMKFMREQAASTRVAKPRPGPAQAAVKPKAKPAAQRTVAARAKPAPLRYSSPRTPIGTGSSSSSST